MSDPMPKFKPEDVVRNRKTQEKGRVLRREPIVTEWPVQYQIAVESESRVHFAGNLATWREDDMELPDEPSADMSDPMHKFKLGDVVRNRKTQEKGRVVRCEPIVTGWPVQYQIAVESESRVDFATNSATWREDDMELLDEPSTDGGAR